MGACEQEHLSQRTQTRTHGDRRGKGLCAISVNSVFRSFIFAGRCTAICITLLGAVQNTQAQGKTGTISGTVKSAAGGVISGAKVTIGNGQVSLSTLTTPDGTYTFTSVEPGTYTLTAENAGLEPSVRRVVVAEGERPVTVDITLGAKHPDPSAAAPAYDDEDPLKPSAVHGAVDPGGYSSPVQAQTSRRLMEGVASLKDTGAASTPGGDAVPPKSSAASPETLAPSAAALEAELEKALAASPAGYKPNHDLGEFYLHTGRLAQGIPLVEKAEHIDPSHYENGYDLALACLEAGDLARARSQLRQMMARHDTAELHDLLGEVEERSGQYLSAVTEYERAAHMDPSEGNIFDWGSELLLHHTYDPAIQVFSSGVERYPRSAKLQIGYGVALYSRARYDEAVKALCAASDLEPSDPRPYFFLGKMSSVQVGRADEVMKRLKRFVELQPANARARFDYAMSLWKAQQDAGGQVDYPQIESLMKKGIALDPKFAEAHLQLGILLAEQQDYSQAIPEYQHAIKLEPDLANAHYRLAQAYTRTGQPALAKQEFEVHNGLHKQHLAESEKRRAEIDAFVYSMKQ